MAQDQRPELLAQMADADDEIRDHTKELLFTNVVLFVGSLVIPSVPLFVGSIAVFAAIWALRLRKVVWVGAALAAAMVAAVIHVVRRMDEYSTTTDWVIDLVVVVILAGEALVATIAALRYRRADAQFRCVVDRRT